MRRLLTVCFALITLSPAVALVASDPDGLSSLELSVDRLGKLNQLWIEVTEPDGTTHRRLLRETTARVSPGKTGRDPAGQAAFATWTERGGEPWSAYSLDGGSSWSAARPLKVDLRLHDGPVSPGRAMPAAPGGLSLSPGGRVYLVQFRTISLPPWRQALKDMGVEVFNYFPHNGHLVRLDPKLLPTIASLDFVERVEPYHPWYRLEAELRDWLEDPSAAQPDRMRVRVMAFEWGDTGKARIARAARGLGAGIAALWPSGHVVELWVDRAQLRSLAGHDDVLWIDRWSPPETDMDLVREDAGTNWLENNFGYCGEDVRGEVLDSGVQDDHPDFDGILLHGPHDTQSHGTSTYGIVFGNGDRDGDGDGKATGHMPCSQAQGIFADFDNLGDRFAHTQELKNDPYFASFQTNSWGNARTTQYTSISHEMDDIIWRLDIAITQSQSNAGDQDSRPQAWAKNIIAVGGIRHYDTLDTSDDAWANGASIGPAADGRIKPDLNYWYDSIYTTTTGSGYTAGFGGTSAATPESAGVLGLMVQMWSDNVWETDPQGNTVFERQPHFSTIKALLINNTQQYPFSGANHDLTRVHQGWGRPNVQIAKQRAATSFIIDEEVPLLLGEPVAYDVDVPEGESELKVTMVYPDPPGTTSSTLHRINDVNLMATSPSGDVYHGNVGLDVATESTPGGSPNGVDTVENVFVVSPEPGIWKVEIEAVEINQDAHLDTPEDDVAFALVVTGGTGSICDAPVADFTVDPNPARVGQDVQFDSTVSGGAGGPYTYRWDFDSDGVTDSTEEDPVHVYRRPYDGVAKLRVRDVENCPETETHPVTITGPDLRYDSHFDLVEVDGNGNGTVDPGEVWDFRINLRNDGNEDAIGVSAEIVADPSNPGTLTVLQHRSRYPDIVVGAVGASDGFYRFKVGDDFPCGEDAVFTITQITTREPKNTYLDEVGAVHILVGGSGPPVEFYFDGFESNKGWTSQGGGEWQFAPPQGLGGQQAIPGQIPKPDPDTPYEGSQVMGNDLTGLGNRIGNYENDINTTTTSPPIDASDAVDVEMELARWLNTEVDDPTFLEISNDGFNWTRLFSDPGGFTEQAWTVVSYDVSDVADRSPSFRIRLGLTSDSIGVQGGWNVDALSLTGVTRQSCEPFSEPFPGEAPNLRVDRGAAGELDLSWDGDCGGGTSFGVYRGDLNVGYSSIAQEPGKCAVVGSSTTVPEGPGTADFFLVVPNEGVFEGSYGADSDGIPRPPAADACYPQDQIAPCAP